MDPAVSLEQFREIMALACACKDRAVVTEAMREWSRYIKGMIDAMTSEERAHPERITAARFRRIAADSGTLVAEVKRFLRTFKRANRVAALQECSGRPISEWNKGLDLKDSWDLG